MYYFRFWCLPEAAQLLGAHEAALRGPELRHHRGNGVRGSSAPHADLRRHPGRGNPAGGTGLEALFHASSHLSPVVL